MTYLKATNLLITLSFFLNCTDVMTNNAWYNNQISAQFVINKDLIDNNFDSIQADLYTLQPAQRLDFLVKLFDYSLPKLNRTEIETPAITTIEINAPKTVADWCDENRSKKNSL